MMKAVVAGLLAAAALMPSSATAQDGRLRETMRTRTRDRMEAPQPRAPRVTPSGPSGRGWGQDRDRQAGRRVEGEPRARDERRAVNRDVNQSRSRNWRSGRTDRPVSAADIPPPQAVPQVGGRDGRFEGRGDQRRDTVRRGWTDRGRDGAQDKWVSGRGDGWNDRRGADRGWDRGQNRGWNRGWRNDRRYDWGRYRTVNRAAYRLPRYYAPSGWNSGYLRFGIGTRLSDPLFAPGYWIDDPYSYRLPDAYGPYRWVRYYDDALLVDIDSGQVLDVIHDLFW